MASPTYLVRLNDPTPWSRRIMPMLTNFRRGGGRVEAREGHGHGTVIAPILADDGLAVAPLQLPEIVARDRIVAASLLFQSRQRFAALLRPMPSRRILWCVGRRGSRAG